MFGIVMKLARFWIFCYCLLLLQSVTGQPNGKVEQYSTEDGLSHQRVTGILKDQEGFMWFGTWNGINRFDGQRFVSFKSAPGDQFQLRNDRIDQIMDDGHTGLWVLAYDNQVYRFDKGTEYFFPIASLPFFKDKKFTFIKILSVSENRVWLQTSDEGIVEVFRAGVAGDYIVTYYEKGAAPDYRLPDGKINFFKEDAEHNVWIGTSKGLCHLGLTTSGRYKNMPLPTVGLGPHVGIVALEENARELYFGTQKGALIGYSKQAKAFSTIATFGVSIHALLCSKKRNVLYVACAAGKIISVDLNNYQSTTFQYAGKEGLHTLFEDRTGCLWIEPENKGVLRLEPTTGTFQYFQSKNTEASVPSVNRFKIVEDGNGSIWINLKGGGFGFYDAEKRTIGYEITSPDQGNFLLPNDVYTIYYDADNILWLTTNERQLIKIVLQRNSFMLQRPVEQSRVQADNEVRGMLHDRNGRLWVGTKAGKLHVYKDGVPVTGLFENQPSGEIGNIYAMLQDSHGTVWLGTKGNGLYKATPTNAQETKYRLVHYLPDMVKKDSLPCKEIYALLEDKQGRIWVGSYDNGLILAESNPSGTRFIHAAKVFKNYPTEGYNRIRHMDLDKQGNIWLATTHGLLVLNPKVASSASLQYSEYGKIPGNVESLANNDIQFVYRDAKDRMWLGTSGGGFCEAVGENPFNALRFINYTTKEGMPNDYVLSCADDRSGHLWIATENGLTKFNVANKTFRNYDTYDGVAKTTFSESAVTKQSQTGRLFFGTTNGVLYFDAENINKKRITTNIAFTNLHIDNEEAGPALSKVFTEKDINYLPELKLKHYQNIISIDYAILDHRFGNQQATAYRLIGFDTAWHDDRQQHRATYTNLPPGDYVFEVKSLSDDLYVNMPFKRLPITISTPPWRTWWAYLLYLLAAGAVLYYIRRKEFAIIRLRNKVALEQKLATLKLDFFTNVSHELRTPLTLIINPLEQIARKEKLSVEGVSNMDIARKNADRMKRFINQLLDLRKVQSDKAMLRIARVNMVDFVKQTADHFTGMAKSKNIALEIIAKESEVIGWVDMDKMDVVLYNLLGNALKFTPEGKRIQVFIEGMERENSFSIAVCDQGSGVPTQDLEKIFELFHEGEQGNLQASKGTGIGLALSKEFIELHGGKIWATNNEHGGLTVTLMMQADRSHYPRNKVVFIEPDAATSPDDRLMEYPSPLLEQATAQAADLDAPLVLLVEDNDELRFFLQRQLGEHYRVETAKDGQDGLEKAVELLPDLIVSDIMMPNMDGIQMLDNIKNNAETSHIPVVLLSAKYSVESRIEGLKYGADNYITKPFHNEVLIASIDNLLRQRKMLFQSMLQKQEQISPEPILQETPRDETVSPPPTVKIMTSRDELFLKDIIQIVEEKMVQSEFNIEILADAMAMSRTTFNKKFKSLSGITPVEFVKDRRLQLAKQLLDTGASNISEVAYEVGFNNPKYFSTCFKEKFHLTPSDYMKTKGV